MSGNNPREIDAHTGVETTGHEWDGIKELNKPLPRWWLLTFYACIAWAIGYWVVYPAWPTRTGYTKGLWGYSQRSVVANEVSAAKSAQSVYRDKIAATALADIPRDQDLLRFAMAAGASAFQTNCAPCHGRSAQGAVGYPNLNDDDWLWGGGIADIERTVMYGIRSDSDKTRSGQMPRFGLDKLLSDADIDAAAEYVLSLSNKSTDAAAVTKGAKIFAEQCANCHGKDGKGIKAQGSANLTDNIWLYGGSKAAVVESIRTGRGGKMPQWVNRLDPVTIKSLAVYVHSLGGGN
ncbi:MAG: cytochrome-c oxidase, cbb3-type subunit III [Hyphomicrobiaceae bacterium]